MCSAKLEDHSATVLRWKQRRKVAPPHRGKGTISSRLKSTASRNGFWEMLWFNHSHKSWLLRSILFCGKCGARARQDRDC